MKPDSDTGFQEVRQAFAETATRHTGIRCKLCQLQSSQEGLVKLATHVRLIANTGIAHQTAERYADPSTPKCYQRGPREPGPSGFAAGK